MRFRGIQISNQPDRRKLRKYFKQLHKLGTKTLDVLKNCSIARDKFLDDSLEKGESSDYQLILKPTIL